MERFWTGRFRPRGTDRLAQRVVPSGFVEVIVHLTDDRCHLPALAAWRPSPESTLIGLQHEPYEVRFDREVEVFAICFSPAGFCSLFGVPLSGVVGTHDDLAAVLGPRFQAFAARLRGAVDVAERLRLAEGYFSEAAGGRSDVTYLHRAERMIRASGGTLRVADVADRLSVSPRQLERAFKDALGLSPKQYMRIARLNLVQGLLEEGRYQTLAEVAYRAGYADQAHFNRDFKGLVGDAPSLYLAEADAYAVNALDVGSYAAAAERGSERVAFVQEGEGPGAVG